jgi:hypothetical protein
MRSLFVPELNSFRNCLPKVFYVHACPCSRELNACRFVASVFPVLCNEGAREESAVLVRSAIDILTGSPNVLFCNFRYYARLLDTNAGVVITSK